MNSIKENVGREIRALSIDLAQISYFPKEDEKMIFERDEIHGDMAMRECYFAVTYDKNTGKEKARFWLGENCQIFWEED